jgi:ABC-type uncharacterized transport system permease subunit
MTNPTAFNLVALASLVPIALLPWRPQAGRDVWFWAALALALVVSVGWAVVQVEPVWSAGFSTALWLTIGATLLGFLLIAVLVDEAWRLAPLLMPYLLLLGILATGWGHASAHDSHAASPLGWLAVHVVVSLATYVLITLGAVAGAAVLIHERALKRRAPSRLSRSLPSVADAELLERRLLVAAEIILGLGIVTGMATQYVIDQHLIDFGHKTLLALAAFVVLAGILLAQKLWGLRGRRAARYVLVVYLLLTLAYPGVKFVTDVILA